MDLSKFLDPVTNKPNNNADGCSLGQYYIDYDLRAVYLCINNKGRTTPY